MLNQGIKLLCRYRNDVDDIIDIDIHVTIFHLCRFLSNMYRYAISIRYRYDIEDIINIDIHMTPSNYVPLINSEYDIDDIEIHIALFNDDSFFTSQYDIDDIGNIVTLSSQYRHTYENISARFVSFYYVHLYTMLTISSISICIYMTIFNDVLRLS